DFAERRVFQVGETGAPIRLGQEEVPKPLGLRLFLELLDDGVRLPAIAFAELIVKRFFVRIDMALHEGGDARREILDAVRVTEIHGGRIIASRRRIRREFRTRPFRTCPWSRKAAWR